MGDAEDLQGDYKRFAIVRFTGSGFLDHSISFITNYQRLKDVPGLYYITWLLLI